MNEVARHARKILAGTRKGTSEPIFRGYCSFEDSEQRLNWWNDELADPRWGRILGVLELDPGRRADAIVVAETGLGVFGDSARVAWLPYHDIEGWDRLEKEPLSDTLRIRRRSGPMTELRFEPGGPFAFVQFLISALKVDARRRASLP